MKRHLKLLAGGQKSYHEAEKKFNFAYATQSRLMGALWLRIRWDVISSPDAKYIDQFFYIDVEEFAIEDFHHFIDYSEHKIFLFKHSTEDCMGSQKIILTEEEALFIIAYYHKLTTSRGHKLVDNHKDYKFLLDKFEKNHHLHIDNEFDLINKKVQDFIKPIDIKLSEMPRDDIGVINYFFMRLCGQDFNMAEIFLSDELRKIYTTNEKIDDILNLNLASYDKSTIELYIARDNSDFKTNYYKVKFICSTNTKHYFFNFIIGISNLQIKEINLINKLPISIQEAALILNRVEYILVYQINLETIPILSSLISEPNMVTNYDNGSLYMVFKEDNSHVYNTNYHLWDDIFGSYFLTMSNQLVIVSSTLENINLLRSMIVNTPLSSEVTELASFKFDEAISVDFAGSEYYDFIEYVKHIKE